MAAIGKHYFFRTSKASSSLGASSSSRYRQDERLQEDEPTTTSPTPGFWDSLFQKETEEFLSTEKPLRTSRAFYYSMSLEPEKDRNQALVMITECFAIFGALFLNGVWFLWEYGNSNDFQNKSLQLAFEICCAIGICTTTFIAMFAVILWMFSLSYSNTQKTFVRGTVQYLAYLMLCLNIVVASTVISIVIAVYNRLQAYNSVAATAMAVFAGSFLVTLSPIGNQMMMEQMPLEVFHLPVWFKIAYMPWSFLGNQPKMLKKRAEQRAAHLRKVSGRNEKTEIEILLRDACEQLGRSNVDLTPYLRKLELDWHDNAKSLRGRNVDFLSKYMPHALAETVHGLLKKQTDIMQHSV